MVTFKKYHNAQREIDLSLKFFFSKTCMDGVVQRPNLHGLYLRAIPL